ncbi:RDD family protein [Frankineae bacterium MT45]|nr:RDD family protein [Frankineae bacterium MT45]
MTVPQAYRGEQLGLPADGPGSLASFGARTGAFIVDSVAAFLIASIFVQLFGHHSDAASRLPRSWVLIPFFADYVIGMLVAGRTLGMNLLGLRIIRVDADVAIGPLRAVARTAMLSLLIPAVIVDRDGRGLHDRITGCAVIQAPRSLRSR